MNREEIKTILPHRDNMLLLEDDAGRLKSIALNCPPHFNFGYDVVDAIAARTPEKRAMVWCNTESEEHICTFRDISRLSNQTANVFVAAGIRRGDQVMVALKRHYEYWLTAVALHKLGAVMIPVTHMLMVEDLVYRMGCTDLKGVVCTPMNEMPEKNPSGCGKGRSPLSHVDGSEVCSRL